MTDGSIEPGYYHADGDPPGTVRSWDGTQWTSEPMPAPPGYDPWGLGPLDPTRFGTTGERIGAGLIDGLLGIVVVVPFLVGYIGDVFDDIDAGGDGTGVEFDAAGAVFLVGIGLYAVFVAMTATLGGSPGKLVMGLRVTRDDATTTPPGWGPAVLRTAPSFVSFVPVLGGIAGFGLLILNVVWVSTDGERRSAHDRVGRTRVVKRSRLAV